MQNNITIELMSNKKTALDWLESQQEIQDMINVYSCDAQLFLRMVFNKAKQMEKEQITESHLQGLYSEIKMRGEKQAEQYYNETYEQ